MNRQEAMSVIALLPPDIEVTVTPTVLGVNLDIVIPVHATKRDNEPLKASNWIWSAENGRYEYHE